MDENSASAVLIVLGIIMLMACVVLYVQVNRLTRIQFQSEALNKTVMLLNDAANKNYVAAEVLQANISVARELAAQDRVNLIKQAEILARLEIKADIGAIAVSRMEDAGRRAEQSNVRQEASGKRVEAAAEVVADNLSVARGKADAITDGPWGQAADEASRTPSATTPPRTE